jgi:hypothetical protein
VALTVNGPTAEGIVRRDCEFDRLPAAALAIELERKFAFLCQLLTDGTYLSVDLAYQRGTLRRLSRLFVCHDLPFDTVTA